MKFSNLAISAVIALLITAGCANEALSDEPTIPPEYEPDSSRIDVDLAKGLVDFNRGVLVDTRSFEQYSDHHAVGAISAPYADISNNPNHPVLQAIPQDQQIILYCT